MAMNFRTNFQPVQVTDALFRHSLTTHGSNRSRLKCAEFGRAVANPLAAVAIKGPQNGPLPASVSFCQFDQPNVALRTIKVAEDGDGIILRLSETAGQACTVAVELPRFKIVKAYRTNLVEHNEAESPHEEHTLRVKMEAHEIATVRLRGGKRWSRVGRLLHF
jgi:alpha-mannosidase